MAPLAGTSKGTTRTFSSPKINPSYPETLAALVTSAGSMGRSPGVGARVLSPGMELVTLKISRRMVMTVLASIPWPGNQRLWSRVMGPASVAMTQEPSAWGGGGSPPHSC